MFMLKNTGEFYDILYQINKKPIRHKIIDLYNNEIYTASIRIAILMPAEEEQDKGKSTFA